MTYLESLCRFGGQTAAEAEETAREVAEMMATVAAAGLDAEDWYAPQKLQNEYRLSDVESLLGGTVPAEELAESARLLGGNALAAGSPRDAIKLAKKLAGEDGAVVVCGSLFLAASLRPMLQE